MKKNDILKDKLIFPLIFAFIFGVISIKNTDNVTFILSLFLVIVFLFVIMLLKNENYVYDFNITKDKFEISYLKNFKNVKNQFSLDSKTIKSIDFDSKFMFDTFNVISIKYIDENGLHFQKKFKIKNDEKFIDLISELKNIKTKQNKI